MSNAENLQEAMAASGAPKMNLPAYLLSKGKGGAKERNKPSLRTAGLKPRDVNCVSPPGSSVGVQVGAPHISTPANVKRSQALSNKWFNSPTDVLSPCSQKLWKRPVTAPPTAGISHNVQKLNLLAVGEEDNSQDEDMDAE
jgi:hypothetical protein